MYIYMYIYICIYIYYIYISIYKCVVSATATTKQHAYLGLAEGD